MKPVKIMYVLDSLANKGGVERVLIDKINFLASHGGYEVLVITYQQGSHPFSFDLHPSVRHLDTDTRFFNLYRFDLLRRLIERIRMKNNYLRKLQSIVDNEKPDIIIITTYGFPICGCVTKLKTNAKLIAEAHIPKSETIEGNRRTSFKLRRTFDKWYNDFQCKKVRQFDALVSLTGGDAKNWEPISKRVVVIPNPVTFYPEEMPDHKHCYKRILAVGRLHKQKGFDLLISAFSLISESCPEWRMEIFGNGDEKDNIQDLIDKKCLQNRIAINPATSHIYQEYLSSDFFVLSSRYEGFGLVLTEAMSCGLPCVAFNCKYGPKDIIKDGEDGLLVEDGNIYSLSEKMLWMISHESERRNMGQKAYQSVSRYRKELVMKTWEQLFVSLLKS